MTDVKRDSHTILLEVEAQNQGTPRLSHPRHGHDHHHHHGQQQPQGYSALASRMTSCSIGSEFGAGADSLLIFRRFDWLNARNLLVLESEIAELEVLLEKLEGDDGDGASVRSGSSSLELRDWKVLKAQAGMSHDGNVDREGIGKEKAEKRIESAGLSLGARAREIVRVTEELDAKLGRYYDMLLRAAEVMKLSRPRPSAREVFFQGPGMDAPTGLSRPRSTAMVHGAMEHHLDVEQEGDLSSLLRWDAVDPMSRLLHCRLGFLLAPFRRTFSLHTHHRVQTLASLLSAVTASIFLIAAIVVLYFIVNPTARLGTLCGFTVIFAGTLASLTSCRRYEVFVATAAYAAVLVVFVSGDLANINLMYDWSEEWSKIASRNVETGFKIVDLGE